MIICSLAGGLGNQLFQYAFAFDLARRLRRPLRLDLSFYATSPDREYALDAFRISGRPLGPIGQFLMNRLTARRYARLRRFCPVCEVRESARSDHASSHRLVHVQGYWQSEAHFLASARELRREFGLRGDLTAASEELGRRIDNAGSRRAAVAVHIRRGDYVTNPLYKQIHGVLENGYYLAASEYISQQVDEPTYFVFSDDVDWAQQQLTLAGKTVPTGGGRSAPEDLALMARCSHFIIANSSFSWWAAWLGGRAESIVVAPRRWYTDPKTEPSGLVPERWLRV